MTKDPFPVRLVLRPGQSFADISSGRAGWAWPLALYAAAAVTSAALAALVPPDFLARASTDLPAPPAGGFWQALAAGLPGGLLFNAFFCALIAAFSTVLSGGRLMFRLPLPAAAVAGYAFFFILRLNAAWGGAAGWLAAGAAAAAAGWAALALRGRFLALLRLMLALSLFTVAADLACAAAAFADSPRAYMGAQYAFAIISLVWLVRGAAAACGLSAARTFAAVLPALLGAAAFAFSLFTLGVVSSQLFQMLLMM
ncbi:MAG: hypothetical protein ACYC2I_06445 [Elusimicrobiales bacterium]